MKNIITTALLCAAAVSANAGWVAANDSKVWEDRTKYDYTVSVQERLVPMDGGLIYWQSEGLANLREDIHCSSNFKINFAENARYELKFKVSYYGSGTNGGLPYCNLSLVTSGNDATLLFGNADTSLCQLGVVFGDVPNSLAKESLVANSAGNSVFSTSWSQNLYSSYYTYTLIFETFEDANIADKIYFGVTVPDGQTQSVLRVTSNDLGLGSPHNKVFDDIGFSIGGADFQSGSITNTVDNQKGVMLTRHDSSFTKWTRTEKPQEPDPAPDVPEPSAVGLLAGLGTIALAVSRSRRSR